MSLGKHRIEALSDGIFAIAMTLLILDIKVPAEIAPGGLGHAITHEGHEWISFLVTFLNASTFWVAQHRVFDLLEEIGTESLVLTFVTLGFVTVLPITTSMWGTISRSLWYSCCTLPISWDRLPDWRRVPDRCHSRTSRVDQQR